MDLQILYSWGGRESSPGSKLSYDCQSRTTYTNFHKGDLVWLFIPTAGKLSPWWEGRWFIQEVKIAVTMKIMNGHHSKVAHVNRLQHKIHWRQWGTTMQWRSTLGPFRNWKFDYTIKSFRAPLPLARQESSWPRTILIRPWLKDELFNRVEYI